MLPFPSTQPPMSEALIWYAGVFEPQPQTCCFSVRPTIPLKVAALHIRFRRALRECCSSLFERVGRGKMSLLLCFHAQFVFFAAWKPSCWFVSCIWMDNTLEHSRIKQLGHKIYCSRFRSRTAVFAGSEYCYTRVIVQIQRPFKTRSRLESDRMLYDRKYNDYHRQYQWVNVCASLTRTSGLKFPDLSCSFRLLSSQQLTKAKTNSLPKTYSGCCG